MHTIYAVHVQTKRRQGEIMDQECAKLIAAVLLRGDEEPNFCNTKLYKRAVELATKGKYG